MLPLSLDSVVKRNVTIGTTTEYTLSPIFWSDRLSSTSDDDGDDAPTTETIFNDEVAVGPAMCALIAAFTTAYEQDRKRRRTD